MTCRRLCAGGLVEERRRPLAKAPFGVALSLLPTVSRTLADRPGSANLARWWMVAGLGHGLRSRREGLILTCRNPIVQNHPRARTHGFLVVVVGQILTPPGANLQIRPILACVRTRLITPAGGFESLRHVSGYPRDYPHPHMAMQAPVRTGEIRRPSLGTVRHPFRDTKTLRAAPAPRP